VVAVMSASGCYFAFPSTLPPSHRSDLFVQGEAMKINTREVKTYAGTCSDRNIEDGTCELHNGKLQHWEMVSHARIKYGGKNLTYAEFRELADPEYQRRIEVMESEKTACTVSLVPSVLAVASVAVAVLVPLLEGGKLSDPEKNHYYVGGAAGAVLFGALSYPLGGYACVRANHAGTAEYAWTKDDWYGAGEEFQQLVDNFNTRIRGGSPPDATAAQP
jgi:hypothetical protein